MIFDSGKHWLIDKRNAEGEALGWLNFNKALAKSDNVYFYEMGNRVGIEELVKYAGYFGIGEKRVSIWRARLLVIWQVLRISVKSLMRIGI